MHRPALAVLMSILPIAGSLSEPFHAVGADSKAGNVSGEIEVVVGCTMPNVECQTVAEAADALKLCELAPLVFTRDLLADPTSGPLDPSSAGARVVLRQGISRGQDVSPGDRVFLLCEEESVGASSMQFRERGSDWPFDMVPPIDVNYRMGFAQALGPSEHLGSGAIWVDQDGGQGWRLGEPLGVCLDPTVPPDEADELSQLADLSRRLSAAELVGPDFPDEIPDDLRLTLANALFDAPANGHSNGDDLVAVKQFSSMVGQRIGYDFDGNTQDVLVAALVRRTRTVPRNAFDRNGDGEIWDDLVLWILTWLLDSRRVAPDQLFALRQASDGAPMALLANAAAVKPGAGSPPNSQASAPIREGELTVELHGTPDFVRIPKNLTGEVADAVEGNLRKLGLAAKRMVRKPLPEDRVVAVLPESGTWARVRSETQVFVKRPVPDFLARPMTVSEARALADSKGFEFEVPRDVRDAWLVAEQLPPAGALMKESSQVTLKFGVPVPNLTARETTIADAIDQIERLGLSYEIDAKLLTEKDFVARQVPQASSPTERPVLLAPRSRIRLSAATRVPREAVDVSYATGKKILDSRNLPFDEPKVIETAGLRIVGIEPPPGTVILRSLPEERQKVRLSLVSYVPDFAARGSKVASAAEILAKCGLVPRVHPQGFRSDFVARQRPADTYLPLGSAVELAPGVNLPDLAGIPIDDANQKLSGVNLEAVPAGRIATVPTRDKRSDGLIVIRNAPRVIRREPVRANVTPVPVEVVQLRFEPPRAPLPDYRGLTVALAVAKARMDGFVPDVLGGHGLGSANQDDTITQQIPPPGLPVTQGSVVSFIASRKAPVVPHRVDPPIIPPQRIPPQQLAKVPDVTKPKRSWQEAVTLVATSNLQPVIVFNGQSYEPSAWGRTSSQILANATPGTRREIVITGQSPNANSMQPIGSQVHIQVGIGQSVVFDDGSGDNGETGQGFF